MLTRALRSCRQPAQARRLCVSIEHTVEETNENSINARAGLGDAVRLHQQRQPESARENNCGRPAGLDDYCGLPRRQPTALQLRSEATEV